VHFWASVVAILLFGIGAGVSIHAGFRALLDPQPIAPAGWSYAVLAVAALFEAAVWLAAWRGVDGTGAGRPALRTLRQSGEPARFTVLLDASVALIGLAAAFVGVFCADQLGWLRADAVAALVTGAILASAALALAIETRRLLIGEAASPDLVEDILGLAGRAAFVEGVNEVRTVHFGPADVLVNISVDARDSLSAGEVETGVTALESEIRAQHPEVGRVFIEIQSAFAGGGPASGGDPGRRPDP
jgi:divalent metal cation (Fe/Co/Zn/Cd) transporter